MRCLLCCSGYHANAGACGCVNVATQLWCLHRDAVYNKELWDQKTCFKTWRYRVFSFFDDLLPRFEFFLPSFDVLLPLVDFLLPIIMSWLHVYPQLAMILGSTSKRRLRTQLLAAAGRALSNLDNEYKRVNFSFRWFTSVILSRVSIYR